MGASSYLTRKPWGPASSRSTRAEGRAPPHEKESPARFRSIAGESHLPRPAHLERARTSQGFETPRRHRRVHETRKSIPHVFQGRFALDVHIRSVLL